jgi:type II secretory pathway pseudopilin PulG
MESELVLISAIISKKKSNISGFSYVEVLVTMVIMQVVLLSMLSIITFGANLLMKMEQTTIASQSIHKRIEQIRNTSFEGILSLDDTFTDEDLTRLNNAQGYVFIDDAIGQDIKKLTVSIHWTFRGRQMIKKVVTFVTRGGINKN